MLTFTIDPLTAPLEIMGTPVVVLAHTSGKAWNSRQAGEWSQRSPAAKGFRLETGAIMDCG
ncbi:hypothetical protein [Streptomyces iakyrus]|uniref:hypothetical protein n=1 Tax=Streptomyces iakyrus TaxID=68219 RepID=UPI003D9149B3